MRVHKELEHSSLTTDIEKGKFCISSSLVFGVATHGVPHACMSDTMIY